MLTMTHTNYVMHALKLKLSKTHTQTHWSPFGKRGVDECAWRPFSHVTSLLFQSSGEKMSAAVFPVQLTLSSRRWCAWMEGLWGEPHLLLSTPPLPPPLLHAHFLLGDSRLCLLSGCPRPQTRGASHLVGNWSSCSKDTPLPSYTWEGKQDLRMAVQRLHPLLPFLLPRRSISLIGSLSHWCIDCGH